MAHPQSSPRGLFAKQRIDVGAQQLTTNASGLVLNNGVKVGSAQLTSDTTSLVLAGGVKISDARYITANSTAYIFTAEAALPTTDNGIAMSFVSNSTGVAVVVNSTGTTWKYLNVTTVQPT